MYQFKRALFKVKNFKLYYSHYYCMFSRLLLNLFSMKFFKGMDRRFEWNWLNDIYDYSTMSGQFKPECEENPLKFECFHEAFMDTGAFNDVLTDDVVYEKNESKPFQMTASRIYLHYKNFFGNLSETETRHQLNWLAHTKYGYATDELIIYSIIDVFFEQMEQLPYSFFSIALLSIEAIVLVSFLLIFDLKTIFLMAAILISCVLAIFSNMILLGVKFDFVVLMHFILLPAFLCEFFLPAGYLYLYSVKKKKKRVPTVQQDVEKSDLEEKSENKSSSIVKSPKIIQNNRLKRLRFAYLNYCKHSAFFLLIIAFSSFLLTNFVNTYAFSMLYKFLLVTFLNLFLHLAVFFPTLLSSLGSNWN